MTELGDLRATHRDVGAVVETLVASFDDDPVMRWLFPAAETRRTATRSLFGGLVGALLDATPSAGMVDVLPDGSAVALWEDWLAGGPTPSPHTPAASGRLATLETALRSRHPVTERHLYLTFVGVRPALRSRGLGSTLLRHRLAYADRLGLASYLETSSPRALGLYERLGFAPVGGTIDLPDGPSVQPMWRPPA